MIYGTLHYTCMQFKSYVNMSTFVGNSILDMALVCWMIEPPFSLKVALELNRSMRDWHISLNNVTEKLLLLKRGWLIWNRKFKCGFTFTHMCYFTLSKTVFWFMNIPDKYLNILIKKGIISGYRIWIYI